MKNWPKQDPSTYITAENGENDFADFEDFEEQYIWIELSNKILQYTILMTMGKMVLQFCRFEEQYIKSLDLDLDRIIKQDPSIYNTNDNGENGFADFADFEEQYIKSLDLDLDRIIKQDPSTYNTLMTMGKMVLQILEDFEEQYIKSLDLDLDRIIKQDPSIYNTNDNGENGFADFADFEEQYIKSLDLDLDRIIKQDPSTYNTLMTMGKMVLQILEDFEEQYIKSLDLDLDRIIKQEFGNGLVIKMMLKSIGLKKLFVSEIANYKHVILIICN